MATSLTLNVGSLVGTHQASVSDAAAAAVIRRFVHNGSGEPDEGMTTAKKNQWYADEAIRLLVLHIKQEAATALYHEKRAALPDIKQDAADETVL